MSTDPATATVRVAAVVRANMTRTGVGVAGLVSGAALSPSTVHRRLAGESPFTVSELVDVGSMFDMTVSDILREAERLA